MPKTNELMHKAKLTKAAVIEISESKLNDSVLTSDIYIKKYAIPRCHRTRQGESAGFCIRNDLSYNIKSYFSKDIENIFFEML